MSSNNDFIRPGHMSSGVLLNNNKEALLAYKKSKKRMETLNSLEEKVNRLEKLLEKVLDKLDD